MSAPCGGDTGAGEAEISVHWSGAPAPGGQSDILGFLTQRGDQWEFLVPDLGWTRWSLDLSPAYRAAICRVAGGAPAGELRPGWLDLLHRIDQRTRDEASRLARYQPSWALDLTDAELTAIVQALAVFPVPDDEAGRWRDFLNRVPPGDTLLALLRAVEGSERPFFRDLRRSYAVRHHADPAFRAFCQALALSERPDACPPLPSPRRP